MANYYSRAVVLPYLPLAQEQLAVLNGDCESPLAKTLAEACSLDPDELAFGLEAEKAGGELYYLFATEGFGDDDIVFLQEVLAGLPEEDYPHLTVECAHTCSKMRSDGFGGSAYVIRRDEVASWSTCAWLEDEVAKGESEKL